MLDASPARLLVIWTAEEPVLSINGVGCLSATEVGYTFEYLPDAGALQNFTPFTSFPDLARPYHSSKLFPFFSSRVIARQRTDFSSTCRALGLHPETATDLQLLDRTGGFRKGDRVAVVGEPSVAPDGTTRHTFLVRGLRFALPDEAREVVLGSLAVGTELAVRQDRGNAVNREARHITTAEGQVLGWVPDALLPYVKHVLARPEGKLRVIQVNGPDQPAHLRLLVQVTGQHDPAVPPLPQLAGQPELVSDSS